MFEQGVRQTDIGAMFCAAALSAPRDVPCKLACCLLRAAFAGCVRRVDCNSGRAHCQ